MKKLNKGGFMTGNEDFRLIGLDTGFSKINKATLGFKPGEFILLGARPGVGKTTLALNIAYNLAVKQDKNVLFFSFEMNKSDMAKRLIAIGSCIEIKKIRSGQNMSAEEEKRLLLTTEKIAKSSLYIDTEKTRFVDILAKIEELNATLCKKGSQLDLIIVDYLQLIDPDVAIIPEAQQLEIFSSSLKRMANKMRIPVFGICQINRNDGSRETVLNGQGDKDKVKLSDILVELEQNADIVMLMNKNAKDGKDEQKQSEARITVTVAKNRTGPTVDQEMIFKRDFLLFQEVKPDA
jgi:replicative DNA helicase